MTATPISRVRMRGLSRPGRFRACFARSAGYATPCASRADRLTDASSIAEALGPRPGAARPRPGTSDLVAAAI